jgi:putative ABC transport system permease protein
VGSTVSLILGDGAHVNARVVAVYGRGLGFGPVAISRDLAAGHTATRLDQSLLIRTDGTDTARRNLTALAASHPGLALGGSGPASDAHAVPPELWINVAVLTVLLGYLLLGIANKLIATTAGRRHEFAALQLIGATPGQIRSMMRREAALICTVALSTGFLLSVVPRSPSSPWRSPPAGRCASRPPRPSPAADSRTAPVMSPARVTCRARTMVGDRRRLHHLCSSTGRRR